MSAGSLDHQFLLLRLANEVDVHADLALQHASNGDPPLNNATVVARMVEISERLAYPELAAQFRRLLEPPRLDVPALLQSSRVGSYLIRPPSSRPSRSEVVRSWKRRVRRVAAAVPGARRLRRYLRRRRVRAGIAHAEES